MRLCSVHATSVGRVRQNNEDAFCDHLSRGLFAVADGIGGHAGGEVASGLAIRAIEDNGTFQQAHDKILDMMGGSGFLTGMGTTLTVAAFRNGRLRIEHVGDSAAFLTRGTRTKQLTEEQHSGNALDNCLGVYHGAFKGAQVAEVKLEVGDVVVLCTDGLTRYLDARAIGRVIETIRFENLASLLVNMANIAGGEDNTTVVAVQVLEVS